LGVNRLLHHHLPFCSTFLLLHHHHPWTTVVKVAIRGIIRIIIGMMRMMLDRHLRDLIIAIIIIIIISGGINSNSSNNNNSSNIKESSTVAIMAVIITMMDMAIMKGMMLAQRMEEEVQGENGIIMQHLTILEITTVITKITNGIMTTTTTIIITIATTKTTATITTTKTTITIATTNKITTITITTTTTTTLTIITTIREEAVMGTHTETKIRFHSKEDHHHNILLQCITTTTTIIIHNIIPLVQHQIIMDVVMEPSNNSMVVAAVMAVAMIVVIVMAVAVGEVVVMAGGVGEVAVMVVIAGEKFLLIFIAITTTIISNKSISSFAKIIKIKGVVVVEAVVEVVVVAVGEGCITHQIMGSGTRLMAEVVVMAEVIGVGAIKDDFSLKTRRRWIDLRVFGIILFAIHNIHGLYVLISVLSCVNSMFGLHINIVISSVLSLKDAINSMGGFWS